MITKVKIAAPMTKSFTKLKQLGLLMALMALSVPMVWADNGDVKSTSGGDPSHQGGDWHRGQEGHMMAQILNLSEDQQKQLKDLKQKQKEAMKSIFEQIKTNKETFEAEIVKATSDMNKINDTQTQIKTLQSQMVDSHLNYILAIKKIMTPEQFAGYMALEKEEDMMKHEGHDKFGHKYGFGDQLGVSGMRTKGGDGQKHWGDEGDKGHFPGNQE